MGESTESTATWSTAPPANGGVAARRAVARWAWRLFRREWRQQALVLALLTLAVTAAVGGMVLAYNSVPLRDAEFGTATRIVELDGSDPRQAEADLQRVREVYGSIDVIGHREAPVPGSVETVDIRSQDPDGPYGGPMLALAEGRYPAGADEVALTDDVAATFDVTVGAQVELDGTERQVVGVVENPSDLGDEFALLDSAHAPPPDSWSILLGPGWWEGVPSFPELESELDAQGRGQTERGTAALLVLVAMTLAMLLIGLVAAAGFVVVAQRRLRQIGMLAAIGATERHLRLVTLANGLVVGAVAALLGAAVALAAWMPLAPALEPVVGHRIDRLDLPWSTIAGGVFLAVVAATAAAWWPARAVARVPVVAALSARAPRPKPARRSAVLGIVLLVVGAVAIERGSNAAEDSGNLLLLVGGMVALVTGVLFVGPLAIRLLAAAGGRAPVTVRLALRDLSRYQARAGAALGAISLGLGIAAMVVVTAAAAQHAPDEGNLADDQLLVRLDEDPLSASVEAADSPDRSPERMATLEDRVDRIAASLDVTTVLTLDAAVDPEFDARGGTPYVWLTTPLDESTSRVVGVPYVATPELLAHNGVDPAEVDPDIEVLTPETSELEFANTSVDRSGDEPDAVDHVRRIDVPGHSEAPTSLLMPDVLSQRGWERARAGWFIEAEAPLTTEQIAEARELAADAGLTIETRDDQASLDALRSGATAGGVLLGLAILAMVVGLIRSEAAGDLRTLTATGATSHARRLLTAVTAGTLALLGVVLGTSGAYVGLIAGFAEDLDRLSPVPVVHLLVLLVGLPLAASLAGWLLAGREPPALARRPIE